MLIQVSAGKEDEVISKLKIYPDIEYAEKDGYYKVAEIPNDPWYYNQWSLLYHEDYYAVNLEPIWGKPTTPTPKPPPPNFLLLLIIQIFPGHMSGDSILQPLL